MRIVKGRLRMDNRKEGLKELGLALAATVIIIAASKLLTNTVFSGNADALYKNKILQRLVGDAKSYGLPDIKRQPHTVYP